MQIHLIAVGTRMPQWVEEGYAEYAKRLPTQLRLTLREIPAGRRTKGADLERLLRDEGERVLAAVPARARVIALERTGRSLATRELAAAVQAQLARGADLALLVGGPEGLAPACLARADETWSLSALTLAHPVVRVVLAEQLYRAWSIIAGTPYHR
ncbi:50S rRNA methyltransferase [Sulfurifustis variabilis]|uniref:Ribosomal RNA large subunit methyltransferase H n=1 Tax=Sulfurifustis variabilis TaxID=1675686 RepID=A0A1B4V788_9GAMM|nr:23S rRNA (pseudouridine(1915)-N(3))-methyltransferase RlmH [Sulfurifustis variabilis]BAU47184.1 50S rRNA methyltransferase [Sulfurifustis variabilis]